MIKKLLFILFVGMFYLNSTISVNASYFTDNFNSNLLNGSIWGILSQSGGGVVLENNGYLTIDSTDSYVPLVYSLDNAPVLPVGDYIMQIKFKYSRVDSSGQGLGIGFFNKDRHNVQQAAIWQDADKGLMVLYDKSFINKSCNDISTSSDWVGGLELRSYVPDGNWHIFEIDKVGKHFNLFLDKEINTEPVFSYDQLCNPDRIFFGNMQEGGFGTWNPLNVDYITIEENPISTPTPSPTEVPTQTPTPTLIPTMTPEPTLVPTLTSTPTLTPTIIPTIAPTKDKIIVIPGMAASWNTAAIVGNVDLPNNQWSILSFVHNYDGLMETLRREGYRDTGTAPDLYLWPYDWRDRVADISSELNSFINANIKAGEKFDLVGHSLGGVVARIWAQDHQADTRLQNVITLGAPNQGTIKAYEVWAGGEVPSDWGWKAVALNVVLETQRQRFLTTVNEVHSVAPVLQDLNPTFTFLKKKSGITDWRQTIGANTFLSGRNMIPENSSLKTITALGSPTKRWIMAEEPSFIDKALMRWQDGKPISYLVDEGDGTVLADSSRIKGIPDYTLTASHAEMVDPSISQVLDILHLPKISPVASKLTTIDNSLVFFIGSPAYLNVTCDNQSFLSDKDGFVVIGGNFKNCSAKVVGTGSGTYHLVVGSTKDYKSWQYYEGEINKGERKTFTFSINKGLPGTNQNYGLTYELIRRDIKMLQKANRNNYWLQKALVAAEKRNPDELLEMIFKFRKGSGEYQISTRILIKTEEILLGKTKGIVGSMAKAIYAASKVNKVNLEKRLKEKKSLSLFNKQSLELFDYCQHRMVLQMENNKYDELKVDSVLSENLLKEVW